MSAWLDLEKRFLEIEVQLRGARLDYQGGAAGEYWRIAASFDRLATSRFEAVSKLAGKKLLAMAGTAQQLPIELRDSPDDATRWYRAMKLQSGHYEHGLVGFQKNDDGTDAGTIFTGHIYSPAAVAATLCLEFSAMANDPSVPAGLLTVNISGTNARFNLGSTDNSSNTYTATTHTVFEGLRAAIPAQASTELRSELLSRIEQMEQAVGKPTFSSRYNDFIQSAANHLTLFAPLLPALSSLLPK